MGRSVQHAVSPDWLRAGLLGLRMAVLLTLAMGLLHQTHWLRDWDHLFMQRVLSHWVLGQAEDSPRSATPALVDVVTLDAPLRVLALEEPQPEPDTIRRVGGVRPVSRAAMAEVLAALDASLAKQAGRLQRPLLAIDIDLAPLEGGERNEALTQALHALSRWADLALIVMPRQDNAAAQRRDEYFDKLCQQWPQGQGRLHLVSPRVWLGRGGIPMDYLSDYPSLGWVMGLQLQARPPQREHPAKPPPMPGCASVHQLGQAEDQAWRDPWHGPQAQHGRQFYNWTLLHSEQLHPVPIRASGERDQTLAQTVARGLRDSPSPLRAPVLLLAVESARGLDHYPTPGALVEPIAGPNLHALQALSMTQPLCEHAWQAPAVDLFLGLLMMLGSLATRWLLLRVPALRHTPLLRLAMQALVLVGLLLLLDRLAQTLAVWSLDANAWVNPVYVLLGLLLHSLLEAWEEQLHAQHSPSLEAPLRWGQWRRCSQVLIQPWRWPLGRGADAWFAWLLCWGLVLAALPGLLTMGCHGGGT